MKNFINLLTTKSGIAAVILAIFPWLTDPVSINNTLARLLEHISTTTQPAEESSVLIKVISFIAGAVILYARAQPWSKTPPSQ